MPSPVRTVPRGLDLGLLVVSLVAAIAAWIVALSWVCATDRGEGSPQWCFPAVKGSHLALLVVGSSLLVAGWITMAISRRGSRGLSWAFLVMSLAVSVAVAITASA
ncbi:hypothetical protein AESSP_02182 [Aestuariimicrobium sp. T2.26MG-19.2B]|nr:hypothetical protein AESSP_02182 [Aestuariimicrobium sp. T2.26MG-19.2B]